MLPDFPDEKRLLMDFWNAYLNSQLAACLAQHPYFPYKVPPVFHREGGAWRLEYQNGESHVSQYKTIETSLVVHDDEVLELSPEKIKEKINKMAEDTCRQMLDVFFKVTLDAASQNGLTVTGSKQGPTKEDFLEMMSRIDMDFDDGQARPMVVMSPQLWDNIKDDVATWEADASFNERVDRLFQQKREDWRARKSRRKLVD